MRTSRRSFNSLNSLDIQILTLKAVKYLKAKHPNGATAEVITKSICTGSVLIEDGEEATLVTAIETALATLKGDGKITSTNSLFNAVPGQRGRPLKNQTAVPLQAAAKRGRKVVKKGKKAVKVKPAKKAVKVKPAKKAKRGRPLGSKNKVKKAKRGRPLGSKNKSKV